MSNVPPGDGGWPDEPTTPGAPPPPPPPPSGYPPPPGYPPQPGQPGQPGQWAPPGYGQQPWQQSPYGGVPYGQQQPQPKNGFGVAALVLGILSIFTGFILIGGLLGVLAVIFGIIGIRRASRGDATNKGMAIAGLITGIIGIIITAVVIVVVVTSDEVDNYIDCVNEADTSEELDRCAEDFADDLEGLGTLTGLAA